MTACRLKAKEKLEKTSRREKGRQENLARLKATPGKESQA